MIHSSPLVTFADRQTMPASARTGWVFGPPAGFGRLHIHNFNALVENLPNRGDDVFGLERFTVVLTHVAVGGNARLGPQEAGKLAALRVFDHDDPLAAAENFADRLDLEWHDHLDL